MKVGGVNIYALLYAALRERVWVRNLGNRTGMRERKVNQSLCHH